MKAGMKCDSNLVAIEIDLNVFIICFSTTHSEEHHFRLCTYTYPKSTLRREKQSSTKLSCLCQVCNTTTFHQQCRHYHHLHQHRRVVSSSPSSSSFKFGSFSHHHVELMAVRLGGPGLPSCWSTTTVCNERPTTTTTMRCRARK